MDLSSMAHMHASIEMHACRTSNTKLGRKNCNDDSRHDSSGKAVPGKVFELPIAGTRGRWHAKQHHGLDAEKRALSPASEETNTGARTRYCAVLSAKDERRGDGCEKQ